MPYVKSQKLFLYPDRTEGFTDANHCADNYNATNECIGYGFDDGLVSDGGYGMIRGQTKDINGKTVRLGRSIAQLDAPSNIVAFGDTYDNPGYSLAADNIFSQLPGNASTGALRHTQRLNFCFVDGHVKSMLFQARNYAGYGLIGVPADPNNAFDWCYDKSVVGTYEGGDASGYPLSGDKESCTDAINGLYANSTLNP